MTILFRNSFIASVIIALAGFGCAEENPLLVNPPPHYEHVNVRLVNLAGDGDNRVLNFDREKETSATQFMGTSPTIKPPHDSSYYFIKRNGVEEYKSHHKQRFMRNYTYTFVALPAEKHQQNSKPVDTVMLFYTSISIQPNSQYAYIKFFNGFPDSTRTYSIRLGCPNGPALAGSVPYRSVSGLREVEPDTVVISLVRHEFATENTIALYKFPAVAARQYCIILAESPGGDEKILVLDELGEKEEALQPAIEITARTAQVRAANFTKSGISVAKAPNETVAEYIQPGYISKYAYVEACESLIEDKIVVSIANDSVASAGVSLGVEEKYTLLVFDSLSSIASKAVLLKPERYNRSLQGKAFVRTVNYSYLREGLTLSLGARTNSKSASGFVTGEALATDLPPESVTGYVAIDAGFMPITLFSATQPAKLLRTAYTTLKAGKKYVIALTSERSGNNIIDRVFLVSEDDENIKIDDLPSGSLTHFLNALPGSDSISVSVGEHLTNARLLFSSSLTTVIPTGQSVFRFNDYKTIQKDTLFSADATSSILNILAGSQAEFDLISFTTKTDWLATNPTIYKRRFINASKEIQFLTTIQNKDTLNPIDQRRLYRTASSFAEIGGNEQKFSLVFFNADSPDTSIYMVDDILLPFNKAYSLIFAGNRSNGFALILHQEF